MTTLHGRELKGIDVYRGQGRIDWLKVAKDDVWFAIIKATEGVDVTDERLGYNARAAAQAGLSVNYYHYGRPDTDPRRVGHLKDAEAEAKDFLAAIRELPRPATLRFESGRTAAVWLDLEEEVPKLGPQEGLEWVLRFCEVVERRTRTHLGSIAGLPVGFYVNKEWLTEETLPGAGDRLLKRPDGTQRAIWVARYGPNNGLPNPKYDPNRKVHPAWGSFDIWQYTSKGEVNGVPERCDLNLARIAVPT